MSQPPTSPPAAGAAAAAAATPFRVLQFPPSAVFEGMPQDKKPDMLGSLPRQLVEVLQSLRCAACSTPFGATSPPFTAPCDHLFCSSCTKQRMNETTKTVCCYCPLCDLKFTEEDLAKIEYRVFPEQKLLLKVYGYLQNEPGFRCSSCRELHPRLNTVRCTSDDCDWKKRRPEAGPATGTDSTEASPRAISISFDLPRSPRSSTAAAKAKDDGAVKGPASSLRSRRQLPRGALPSVRFEKEGEAAGDLKKRKMSDEDDQPSCSTSSQLTGGEEEAPTCSSLPSVAGGSEAVDDSPASPFTCVWCAAQQHRECELAMIAEEEEPSPRKPKDEMLRSIDGSFKTAWALLFCGLCWERFDLNGKRKDWRRLKRTRSFSVLSDPKFLGKATVDCAAVAMACSCACCKRSVGRGGCIGDFVDEHTTKHCHFCSSDVSRSGLAEQSIVYLNELLETVQHGVRCSRCRRAQPTSNMAAGIKRCVWCELESLDRMRSVQHNR